MGAEDQLLRIFPFERQLAGGSEAGARKTAAELLAEVCSKDTRFFTRRKVYPIHSRWMPRFCRLLFHEEKATISLVACQRRCLFVHSLHHTIVGPDA